MRATPPTPTVTFSAARLAGAPPETRTASRTATATMRRRSVVMTSFPSRASASFRNRLPVREPRVEALQADVDGDDRRHQDEEPGQHAGGVEHRLRIGDDVAHPFVRAEVFPDHGADQGEADAGAKAREDPREGRGEQDVADHVARTRPEDP